VIARQSTDAPQIDAPDIAAAVRFVRNRAAAGIKVADVLRAVPVSRRVLEYGFDKHLGKTVHQEIVRVRLEHAKTLLPQTQLPMPAITERCGFSYPSQLCHLFKKHTGTTPTDYRRRYSR